MHKSFLLVAWLLVLSFSALAQDADFFSKLHDVPEEAQAFTRIMVNPIMRAVLEEGADRSGIFISILCPLFPGLQDELGITHEHMGQFRENLTAMMEAAGLKEEPEVLRALERNISEDANHVPSEEAIAEIESIFGVLFDQMNVAAVETFTDEQMQRLDNAVFGITGGLQSPFINERHMDALGMTDEQKAQFKKINEETGAEREKMMATFDADIQKMVKTGKISVKDILGAMSKIREFGSVLQKRRSAVLTPAQIAKAKEMAKLPKSMTWSVFDFLPAWAPDANSWKPGDPIPGRIIQPAPRGNFPRGATESETQSP